MSLNATNIFAEQLRTTKANASSWPLAQRVIDTNLTLDEVFANIFEVGGTWQFDDSNHTDYPIITRDLVSGQRDYPFTSDVNGNLILDVYKVFIQNPNNSLFTEIHPVDVQSQENTESFTDGQNLTGTPYRYEKTANGIFLDPIPDYDATNGLKIYINREGSYFTTSDTTKKPGFAGLFHEILVLGPCYKFARDNSLPNADRLFRDKLVMIEAIREHYANRERDVRTILQTDPINFK